MIKQNRKSLTWAAAEYVLVRVAAICIAPIFAQASAQTIPASEAETLSVIGQNAPAVARAISCDKELRSIVGEDKWPLALHRLAEFSKSASPDCKEALRIIGDTVTRAKSRVGTITLDGAPTEWSDSMPCLEFLRPDTGAASDLWKCGAAAVVRQNHLYLMAGITEAAQCLAQPDNDLRVTIDCRDDRAWDVFLSITLDKGALTVKQMPADFKGAPVKVMSAPQAALGATVEMVLDICDFVPLAQAKPIWTLQMDTLGKNKSGVLMRLSTKEFSIFNEHAQEGVAAEPYVRTFLCLCADKRLDDFGLTAAAIAIMSSSSYAHGDEAVRQKIRLDNAAFLEFARSVDAWQVEAGTKYRLKQYPLEAQLAWATRTGEEYGLMQKDRDSGGKANLEDYFWASTSIETFKKLKSIAIQEGLVDADLAVCSERLEEWVKLKQKISFPPQHYRNQNKGETDPKKRQMNNELARRAEELANQEGTAGYRNGKPVATYEGRNTDIMLELIEKNGFFVTTCGGHTMVASDLMRAVGIAPLRFNVASSRQKVSDHVWPARYDPSNKLWLAYQDGRRDKSWWYFNLPRGPVYSYVAEARRFPISPRNRGPRPFPFVFCREIQGFDVQKTSHAGIPTKDVREWMLTPCF